jgi:phage terminase large subunit-like protein
VLLAQHLDQTYGIGLVGVRQDWPSMSTATALMVNAVKSGAARLGGCPKLTQHLRNARLAENLSGQTRFTSAGKGSAKEHIDAAIAAAIGLYALETQDNSPSVYETRGVLAL